MKNKKLIFLTGLILLMSLNSFAQSNSKNVIVNIQTSAQCGMCKARIEETLGFVKGVKTSELNLNNKIVTVTYNPEITNPVKIREAISKSGYDADEIKADPKAYSKLPMCCKKPEDRQ